MSKSKQQPRTSDGKFASFQPEAPLTKSDMGVQTVKADSAVQLTRTLRMRSHIYQDSALLYRPSDNIFVSASGVSGDSRPSLEDLWALMNIRVGPPFFVTNVMAADVVRNWHQFVDPDTRKPIINDTTKAMHKWAIKSDLRNQAHQLVRKERGCGSAFLIKYWTAHDKGIMEDEPPTGSPPRKFRAFSPRYMTPINLNQSNELDYNEDIWKFSGGVFAAYGIHQDRVHVLNTRPEEGNWRGLSVFEPVWLSLLGYMQSFIYMVKAFRKWGAVIPHWAANEFVPEKAVATKYLDLLDEYEFSLKFVTGKEEKLQFIQTQIGKGVKEAFEQYKEDMSSAWRVPLNQLFGRSEGGGLAGAGALVSKEDLLQEESNIQMSLTDDFLRIYSDAGWDVENYDLEWLMSIRKTDEQKLREEGMELQNKILKEQLKSQKKQNKLLDLQIEQGQQPQFQQPGIPGAEGEGGETELLPEVATAEGGEEEEGKEKKPKKKPTDFMQRYWNSIRIDNHIVFPYGDRR